MKLFLFAAVIIGCCFCSGPKNQSQNPGIDNSAIKTGAEQTEKYLPLLQGKRVAMMANPTSIIGTTHLVDSLKSLGINIVKVFGPEHGFGAMPVPAFQ